MRGKDRLSETSVSYLHMVPGSIRSACRYANDQVPASVAVLTSTRSGTKVSGIARNPLVMIAHARKW